MPSRFRWVLLLVLMVVVLGGCYESYEVRNQEGRQVDQGRRQDLGSICGNRYYAYDGVRTVVCQNGDVAHITYRQGVQHGRAWSEDAKGVLRAEADFRDGKLHGRLRAWYADRHLSLDARYEQGRLAAATFYDHEGKEADHVDWHFDDENHDLVDAFPGL